jgi:voltage-gated potassium channel Kch
MKTQSKTVAGRPDGVCYADLAAEFIAEAARIAGLGLPVLPEDPAQAAAMRAAGYDVLAECTGLDGVRAVVRVTSEDEELTRSVPAGDLAAALGLPAAALPGTEFLAVVRETLEDGWALSRFRPVPPVAHSTARHLASL